VKFEVFELFKKEGTKVIGADDPANLYIRADLLIHTFSESFKDKIV
jgi:hypothetical protein